MHTQGSATTASGADTAHLDYLNHLQAFLVGVLLLSICPPCCCQVYVLKSKRWPCPSPVMNTQGPYVLPSEYWCPQRRPQCLSSSHRADLTARWSSNSSRSASASAAGWGWGRPVRLGPEGQPERHLEGTSPVQEWGRFWSDRRVRAGCPGKRASPAFQFFYLVKEYHHLRYSHASFHTVPSTWKVPPLSPVIFQVALKLIHSFFHWNKI